MSTPPLNDPLAPTASTEGAGAPRPDAWAAVKIVLYALAEPYANHPDYRDDWRFPEVIVVERQ